MNAKPSIARMLAAATLVVTLFAPAIAMAQDSGLEAEVKSQIEDLNKEVKEKKSAIESLQSKAERYRSIIGEKKEESATLEDQIALLENRIAKTQLDIDIARAEVKTLELEMSVIDEKVGDQEKLMEKERRLLGALSRKLYRAQFRKSAFEILLSHGTLSEFFNALHAVASLQGGVNKTLARVTEIRLALKEERGLRENKRLAVEQRKRDLDVAKRELEDQRALKDTLLIETKASELEYRYLLAELKREQNQADSEISYLEKVLREKLDIADRLKGDDTVLSWPVVPARGISARFHDPDYPFRNVFEHPAIDIRSGQGTAVRAAAAGVVARAKDSGMGYSYVMIIHNNDISTVYGHLSRIAVKEDAFVERGEVIGYSGGLPGTPGAGRLTTGPHLHFETRLRGIPVDPLRFLVSL
jgi:murein DD-endopeptidase MepM/ murein hydrolase activator NlpD